MKKFVEKALKMPHSKEVGYLILEGTKVKYSLDEDGQYYFDNEDKELVESISIQERTCTVLPRSIVEESDFNLGDVKLVGSVLEDGRRVIKDTGLFAAFGRQRKGEVRVEGFPPIIGSKTVADLIVEINPIYKDIIQPIEVAQFNGQIGKWYDASSIAIISDAYIEANERNLLNTGQRRLYEKSMILLRSLAKVGIVALIDEATQYQELRENDGLQQLLQYFISEELRAYTKEFPKEYYEQVFRLHGWEYDPTSHKRSPYVGKFTNKYVYSLLPKNVWEEIDRQNPLIRKSQNKAFRKFHIHRQLTDAGVKQLRKRLDNLIPIMTISKDIDDFKKNYSHFFAKELLKNRQMENNYQYDLLEDYQY